MLRQVRIHMYHGQKRIRDPARLASEFDLVVTTYQTIAADRGKFGLNHPTARIEWYRVVLDEAHMAKCDRRENDARRQRLQLRKEGHVLDMQERAERQRAIDAELASLERIHMLRTKLHGRDDRHDLGVALGLHR